MLPVHFLFDPGPEFDWNTENVNLDVSKKYESVYDNRLQLIKKYLVTEEVIVSSAIGISFFENMEVESNQRQRSHSWTGPKSPLKGNILADKTGRSTSRTLGRESTSSMARFIGKEKEPTKVTKQMHSMVKSFGSFGKSMGKRLKKNFGSITKAMKHLEVEKKDNSCQGTTETSHERKFKLTCARLLNKTLEYQGEMVANYLEAAKHRFQQDQISQGKSKDKANSNSGPDDKVVPTSKICKEDTEAPHDTLSGTDSNVWFQRQDTLVNQGNSKFYTLACENHKQKVLDKGTEITVNCSNVQSGKTDYSKPNLQSDIPTLPQPVEFARSSFYDKSLSQNYETKSSFSNS